MTTRKTPDWINLESLCKIVETLKANGVADFKYKDLHIMFNVQYTIPDVLPINYKIEKKEDSAPDLSELVLSDPLAFEEAQFDERTEEENHIGTEPDIL